MKRKHAQRFCMAAFVDEVMGADYSLGNMDCFMLIILYLRRRGVKLPDEFKGQNLHSYSELYECESDKAKLIMTELMDSIFGEGQPDRARPGDVVLVKVRAKNHPAFLAINAGNGFIVFAAKAEGVMVSPIKYYRILRGWKWQAPAYT